MTPQQLADSLGIPLARAQAWVDPINATMARFEINTPKRIAAFLAQIGHESVLLTHTVENLNYTADGLVRYFHTRFTAQQAIEYAHRPDAIANRAYANRYGNGDEASGDGWKYRGRGLIQVTFRNNYRDCGQTLGLPLEDKPDLLTQPKDAALSAGWYWNSRDLNKLADVGRFTDITIAINGGTNGLDQRLALYNRALPVLMKGAA